MQPVHGRTKTVGNTLRVISCFEALVGFLNQLTHRLVAVSPLGEKKLTITTTMMTTIMM